MSDQSAANADTVAIITDPGEQNREQHLWGDRLVVNVGNIFAWLFPILIIAIVAQVFLRGTGNNQAWLDDLHWWLYGAAMLAAFCYSITLESHVRVDILHQFYSPQKKARTELFALGWLLLPFLIMMTDIMFHYALASWTASEGSDSPNGLHRLYLLKALLPVLFGVGLIATFAALQRHLTKLTRPHFWKYIVAALPGFWFLCERACFYALWWFTRISQPELNPRRIAREEALQHTIGYGFALLVVILIIAYVASKRSAKEA